MELNSFSQNYDLAWPLGYDGLLPGQGDTRANINFSSGSPVIDTVQRKMPLNVTNCFLSDSTGNILFSSNGCYILNANGDTMMNGNNLNPNQCTSDYCPVGGVILQGNLILPYPNHPNQFWLFHETCNYSTNGFPVALYYSVIDLNLDSGRGMVTIKNQVAILDTLNNAYLTATKHANGIDWWIVCNKYNTNTLISFLLSTSGLSGPFYQTVGPTISNPDLGSTEFSPNGMLLASSNYNKDVSLYSFDRCIGNFIFRESIDVPDTVQVSFLEFSRTGQYLYVVTPLVIYQYDLQSANIFATKTIVATFDGTTCGPNDPIGFHLPRRGIDGKIYISTTNGCNYLHVINYPDSGGVACHVVQRQITLPCFNRTVPNIPNYRLGALSMECNTTVDEFKVDNFAVYPNPSNGYFTVELSNPTVTLKGVSLKDVEGRVIFYSDKIKNTINVAHVNAGIYFLNLLTSTGRMYSKKIIILE